MLKKYLFNPDVTKGAGAVVWLKRNRLECKNSEVRVGVGWGEAHPG